MSPAVPPRPPRLPLSSMPAKNVGPSVRAALPRPGTSSGSTCTAKRPPPAPLEEEPVESFSMATPRKEVSDTSTSRHYIGTPRAAAILSAFLDFDDQDAAATDGPPLDFDEAMAALAVRPPHERIASPVGISGGCSGSLAAAAARDECDSSGSTRCTSSDADHSPGLVENVDDSEEEEENGEGDREEDYESDFETDTESEYESEEEEEEQDAEQGIAEASEAGGDRAPAAAAAPRAQALVLAEIPPFKGRRSGSCAGSHPRSHAGSRAGSCAGSRAGSCAGSRPKGDRECSAAGRRIREGSAAGRRTREGSAAGRRNREGSAAGRRRRRDHSEGAVQRLRSLDRVLTMLTAQ